MKNDQKIVAGPVQSPDKKYVVSNYIEGGLTKKILAAHPFTETAIDRYSQSYILSHLMQEGIDVLRSPHSGRKLQISKELILVLRFFSQPGTVKEFLHVHGSSPSAKKTLYSLIEDKFIFPVEVDQSKSFYLLYAEIDPNTVCNQACVYCPVSVAPRKKHEIEESLFDNILEQLKSLKSASNELTVFLTGYNECTLDKRYISFVGKIKEKGFNHVVISNGSYLEPRLIDSLLDMGINDFAVNIPALDEEEYYKLRGTNDIKQIVENIDYLASKQGKCNIIVHGTGDLNHYKNFIDLKKRYCGGTMTVSMGKTMDRGGVMKNDFKSTVEHKKTFGCMNHSSRLINWIHVNSQGVCFICPMDYYYCHIVGNLKDNSLEEVLSGDKLSLYRKYAYGIEEMPADFICRNCVASIPSSWKEISERDMVKYSYKKNYFQIYLKNKSNMLPAYFKMQALSLARMIRKL